MSGRPSTSRNDFSIAQEKDIIHVNRRLTVQEVAEETGISTTSCHTISTEDLGMHHISVKFVPRLLTKIREFNAFQFVKFTCNKRDGESCFEKRPHWRRDLGLWT
jgi:hypothetical protein